MTETTVAPPDPAIAWHALSPTDALERQTVTPEGGLSVAEVDVRRARYGPNRFADAPTEPRLQAFLRQYKDPMQIVLLAAGILSLFIPGQVPTGIVLIG